MGEMSYWDDKPPKRSKDELKPSGACHEGKRERVKDELKPPGACHEGKRERVHTL